LIPRYTRPEMGRIWSDENRFRTGWLWKSLPPKLWPRLEWFPVRRPRRSGSAPISAWSASTKSKPKCATMSSLHYGVAEIVGPDARWFHYGLTSNDVVDTAQAY